MLLKRGYTEDGSMISHVDFLAGGEVGDAQHFSPRILERGMAEGWLSIVDGRVILRTADGDPSIEFSILEAPGTFCCFCNARQASSPDAQAHIAAKHADKKSPDPQNPAGYRVDNFHRAERVA